MDVDEAIDVCKDREKSRGALYSLPPPLGNRREGINVCMYIFSSEN